MAIGYNPRIVTDGLVLALDAANTKSYSAKNLFENPTDILSWMGTAIGSASNGTLSRDTTVSSPVGNSPMKMVCTGSDTYTQTWGASASAYLISSASQGETFTVSVWAKTDSGTPVSNCDIIIFDANSSGSWDSTGNNHSKATVTITDTWQRFSFTRTTAWSDTAYIQVRLDGPNPLPSNPTTTNIWWDGMQVERSSTATDFSYNGPSTALDMSGKGNSGSISNLTHTSGTDGYFDFNGTSSFATVSSFSDDSNTALSVFCWINPDTMTDQLNGDGNYYNWIINKRPTISPNSNSWQMITSNSKLSVQMWDSSSNAIAPSQTSALTLNVGQWQYVGFTTPGTNGSTLKHYVNGLLDFSGTLSGGRGTATKDITIGKTGWDTIHYWNGKISNIQIYNRELTSAEVKQNFNALKMRYNIISVDVEPITDLRQSMDIVGSAIVGGRTNYKLTTDAHNISYGTDSTYIPDGVGDMYDSGNYTICVTSNISGNFSSGGTGNSEPVSYANTTSTTPNGSSATNYKYAAGGWVSNATLNSHGALVVAATTGNSGNQYCGLAKGGNSGADGSGTKSQVDLYSNDTVNGFTVYASYMMTTGAGDPSVIDLFILLGHQNWGTSFGTITKFNNTSTQYTNDGMWSVSTGQNNVLAIAVLAARTGGNAPVQSEMQGIVDDIIADIKSEFGY